MRSSHHAAFFSIMWLALASACDSAPADVDAGCAVGSRGCECTSGGACDDFLVCVSDLCVDPTMPIPDAGPRPDGGQPRDAGADAGADAGPPCALATSSLPPVASTPRPAPASDSGYWIRASPSTAEYHSCAGPTRTLTFGPHPVYGMHMGLGVTVIDARRARITRTFAGDVRLTEIYDIDGSLLSEHTAGQPGADVVDVAGVRFFLDPSEPTLHSIDTSGTERSVALDPTVTGRELLRMATPGIMMQGRAADGSLALFAWDGIAASIDALDSPTTDRCTASLPTAVPTRVELVVAAHDPANFYFVCSVGTELPLGAAHEIVQVVDGVEACATEAGVGAPYFNHSILGGVSGTDASGNLWLPIRERGPDGVANMDGVGWMRAGTCEFAARTVPIEYRTVSGCLNQSFTRTRVLGVTETMAWTYRSREVCTGSTYEWPYERFRVDGAGAIESVP